MSENSTVYVGSITDFSNFAPSERANNNKYVKESLSAAYDEIKKGLVCIFSMHKNGIINASEVDDGLRQFAKGLMPFFENFSQDDCDDAMQILYANQFQSSFGYDRFILSALISQKCWRLNRLDDILNHVS